MGCFNIQDAITKNSITYGTQVKFMLISKVFHEYSEPACYITDNWSPISTILDAEYDDYGSVENIKPCKSLEILEEYMGLDINQIVEIIRENLRSLYSVCSPIIKIYRPELSNIFYSYDTEISIENIFKLSDKFEMIDESKLKYTVSPVSHYTFEFDFEKSNVNIHQFNYNYFSKQFHLYNSWDINFQYNKHIRAFFEIVYDKTKFLFLFNDGERVIIEKLLKTQLFVFTGTCFDYIMKTKKSKNSKESINKKLQEFRVMYDKLNETTDEEAKHILEWQLEDNETLYRCIPSNEHGFKRIYNNEKILEITEDYTNFNILMNFLKLINIEIAPSIYASQQTFRHEEYDFHKFCAKEAKSKI